MRIHIYIDNNAESNSLVARLSFFEKNSPNVVPYMRYLKADDSQDDLAYYGINVLPTVLALDCSGACIWRMEGFDPRYEYEEAIFKQVKHAEDADQFPQWHRGNPKYAH